MQSIPVPLYLINAANYLRCAQNTRLKLVTTFQSGNVLLIRCINSLIGCVTGGFVTASKRQAAKP